MRHRPAWAPLLVLALLCSGAAGAASALRPGKTTPAPAAATPPPATEVIAAADLPARADIDERFAQDVLQRARGRNPADALTPRLDALITDVRARSAMFRDDELLLLPVLRLESIDRHWRFFDREVTTWRAELKKTSDRYLADAADLGRRRAEWAATLASPDGQTLAPVLRERIVSVQAQLLAAEQAISAPIGTQVTLARRANALARSIDAGEAAVAAAIAYSDSRLLKIDAPPLWKLGGKAPRTESQGTVERVLDSELRFLDEYNAANGLLERVHNLFTLLLLPYLLWLSRRSRAIESDDPRTQAAARVLRRPFSSWLLLVATLPIFLYPEAPVILHQIALFLALVPVLRLLPPHVYQVLGPWPYVATGLYLLYLSSLAFIGNEVVNRYYVLGVTAVAAGLLAWLLWRSRAVGDKVASRADPVVRPTAWIAIALLLVSLGANVFGNTSLAGMLTTAVIISGYAGLVLYAGVHVVASILRLLFARRSVSRVALVARHAEQFLQAVTWLLRVAALAGWTVITLTQLRLFRPIYGLATDILTYKLTFGELNLTLGHIALFGLSIFLAFWVAKLVRYLLNDEVLPKMSLPRGVANSVATLSYYALLLIGLFVALAAAGFEIGQLTIVIGALGVGIGLGLQSVVNNFVSGLILMFERPIQPGDVVEISGTSGTVRDIGMRATTLTTFEGADVVVPNGTVLSEKLINWTLSTQSRRLDISLGVAYGTDPKKMLSLLMDVTKATPGVAMHPEPTVLFVGFGESALNFSVRAWTDVYGDWVKTRSDLAVRVHDALAEAGIEIPFPQRDLHLRSFSDEALAALQQATAPGPAAAGDTNTEPPSR